MIIIGITGTIGAGKGTLVEYLVEKKDFVHYSVRGFLTEELRLQNRLVNRDTMVLLANELRKKNSPSYIIDCLYERAKLSGKNAVIESIRTPGEVESLRKKGNFCLLAIDADPKIRYERIVKRNSETDHIGFDEFLFNEQREMISADRNKQNLSKCIEMADCRLTNNKTISDLYQQLEDKLSDMSYLTHCK
ncbi:MAG: AAA family ATPase [Bacteroidales bacterium]|jgi:dephospho-CoA kinase|nr:AAA family ATPase [Bacteroidales bacterium]